MGCPWSLLEHGRTRSMLGEKLSPNGGHRDEFEAVFRMTPYEATLSGIFPNRKTGAGGAPCTHYL